MRLQHTQQLLCPLRLTEVTGGIIELSGNSLRAGGSRERTLTATDDT